MRNETVLWEPEGSLGYITLNRPEKLNALSGPLLREFDEVLEAARADERVRVVIIRGAGRAFSAGFDLGGNREERGAERDIVDDLTGLQANMDRWLRVWDFPKPVIAQVHGYCLAGASMLCVMTDLTIAAEDARFGTPSLPLGGGWISPLWTWLVGPKRAKEVSLIPGLLIDGRTASDWGLVNRAVPADQLADDVRQTATAIARVPAKVLRLKKASINRTMDVQGFRVAVGLGSETDAILHAAPDIKQYSGMIRSHGMKAAIERFQRGDVDEQGEQRR